MSQIEQENSFENIGSHLIDMLNAYDQKRQTLYDSLATIAVEAPAVQEYQLATSNVISEVALAYTELAKSVRSSETRSEAQKIVLAQLWRQDDNERVELFASLVECNCFEAMTKEETEQAVEDIYSYSGDEDELAENMYEVYRAYLSVDVKKLAEHIEQKRLSTQSESMFELTLDLKVIQKGVRSLATIALAASAGVLLTKQFRRR